MGKISFVAKLIATFFGSGLAPKAPGTFGTFAAAGVSLIMYQLIIDSVIWYGVHVAMVVISYIAGIWAINQVKSEWGKDPGKVVIDEACGYWISILFVPKSLVWIGLCVLLFRFFDITKVLGIRKIDALKTTQSVMLDDVVAGIYTGIVLLVTYICLG